MRIRAKRNDRQRQDSAYSRLREAPLHDGPQLHDGASAVLSRWQVQTERGTTAVRIGPNALSALPRLLAGRAATLVVDRRVLDLYRARLMAATGKLPVAVIPVPRGERAKTLGSATRLWRELARLNRKRGDVVVGVGGGATLDVAGFVASTWMRGGPWIAVPTTLLAQCDACLGGKTGINLAAGKNLIGTFHPAQATLIDPDWVATCPPRDHRAARFELLKYGWLGCRELDAAEDLARLRPDDTDAIAALVEAALRTKAGLVERDLEDRGPRRTLNLGHTFAHALETAAGYRNLRHGEAVGIGLLAAAAAASELGVLSAAALDRKRRQVLLLKPPAIAPELRALALEAVGQDKKRKAGERDGMVLVLPTARSAIVRSDVSVTVFARALNTACEWAGGRL